jgi:hypothetical protein
MKKIQPAWMLGLLPLLVLAFAPLSYSQKKKPAAPAKPQTIVFAVLNGGKSVEPIAYVEKGKMKEIPVGAGQDAANKVFVTRYYRPASKFSLIFGGGSAGTVTVKKSNIGTECGGSSADASTVSTTAKLSELVMGLATNGAPIPTTSFRRRPTASERTEIEALVRAEYAKQGVKPAQLHYHNLTAMDIDRDETPEFFGSYWIEPSKDQRATLFVIAEKGGEGKYLLTHTEYEVIKPDDVMSGDLKDLDTGIYQSLLIDVMDIDGDGAAEVFTIAKAFEGNNYLVYRRSGGKWEKTFETYSYRCAY